MKKSPLFTGLFGLFLTASLQLRGQSDLAAYALYSASGEKIEFGSVVSDAASQDVVLFGELHNDPISHWLQLEMMRALIDRGELVVGAEMFETDDQIVLDEYLSGMINLDHLKKEAKLWPNYDTDYAPLVELAKEKEVNVVATNVPRRYASLVSREGQGALLAMQEAKPFLPSLPFEVTPDDRGYAEMKDMMGAHGHGMNMDHLIEAQALKDHCMAERILESRSSVGVFLHFNGSFHSQYRAGIVGYLEKAEPKIKVLVIAAVSADDLEFQEDWMELGDVILVTRNAMTKTH